MGLKLSLPSRYIPDPTLQEGQVVKMQNLRLFVKIILVASSTCTSETGQSEEEAVRQPKLFYVSSSTTTTTISTQTVCYHVLSTATTNVPDPTLCSKRSPSENKTNRNFENFISFWLT